MLVVEGLASVDAEFQMWMKFRALASEKKDILVSRELVEKIQEFKSRFKLQEAGIVVVSLMIRKLFFGELDKAGAVARIRDTFSLDKSGDPNQAEVIVEAIEREVMTIKPIPEVEAEEAIDYTPKVTTIRLPLLKAMSEYKHVADQMITSEKLKLRNSQELVRPTLSNWIRSYREELGIGFHEPVARGKFLFQTQNGKKLTNEDRAKLNLILKSIEESFPLEIDPKREMIVFPDGSDVSMELTQVNTNARPVANRFIQPRAMPVGTVRPAAFAPGIAPVTPSNLSGIPAPKPSPATPVLATLKPLFSKAAPPEKNISGETLHFSTGHVLPAEKASGTVGEKPAAAPAREMDGNAALRQMQPTTSAIKRQPGAGLPKSSYTIRPLRLRNDSEFKT